MSETTAKKSVLSKDIKLKKVKMPEKTTMNFIHDDSKERNRNNMILFGILAVFLLLFTKFGVLDPLMKVGNAEAEYNNLQSSLDQINAATQDYNQVAVAYDALVGSFLTEDEKESTNRPEILTMIEEDILPSIGVNSVAVSGANVSVKTDSTTLATVSNVITTLQNDPRNKYVTVTTTAASNSDNHDEVTAAFEITYASSTAESEAE